MVVFEGLKIVVQNGVQVVLFVVVVIVCVVIVEFVVCDVVGCVVKLCQCCVYVVFDMGIDQMFGLVVLEYMFQ